MIKLSWQSFSHSDVNGMIRFKKKLQDLKVIIRHWVKAKRLELSGSKIDITTELGRIDKVMDSGMVDDAIFHKKLLKSQADDLEIGSISISHLFYADDTMFIGEWSDGNLKVGVPHYVVEQAASSIGCSILNNQFRYLGVMVGECSSRLKAWDDIILKLRSRLSKWKVKTLSIGGDVYAFEVSS
ncbi:hypothetical protein Tco_0580913 [Tanacetum coccineum]